MNTTKISGRYGVPTQWRWRDTKVPHQTALHQFELNSQTGAKSRCGMVVQTEDAVTLDPLDYQKCRACLKLSRGIAHNAKSDWTM